MYHIRGFFSVCELEARQVKKLRITPYLKPMDAHNLSDLPEWDDERFSDIEDDGEEWKPNSTRPACKALYNKWREVVFMLKGLFSGIAEKDNDYHGHIAGQLLGDAYLAGVKIMSSEAGGIYILRMGNAAIVRELAMGIYSGLLLFKEDDVVDEEHIRIVRDEIDNFRKLFTEWVNTFQKDEFKDEWGLFI